MMKIHSINLNEYKNNIYDFLFYRDNLVYFYILFYNIALLIIVSVPIIFWSFIMINNIVWSFISLGIISYLVSFFELFGPFISMIDILGEWFFGPMIYFSTICVLKISFFIPIFTLITLVFTYIQKDRIIGTSYYNLFKNRLIDLFDKSFTKYFLLFFVILVFYFIVCLCMLFLSGFKLSVFYSYYIIDQAEKWLLPFLYSLLYLFFWWLIYHLYVVQFIMLNYLFVTLGIFLFFSIYLIVPLIFFNWEGGIYHYDGSYNWYVIYKLSRYFIIYPIVMIFIISLILFLFLYFIKRKLI